MCQAAVLLVLSMLVAGAVNTIRPGGLSWSVSWTSSDAARMHTADLETITPEEAWSRYEQGKILFVDARERFAFEQGHLPGALNVPVSDAGKYLDELRDRTGPGVELITYCDGLDCALGSELAGILRSRGIPSVRVLAAGWVGWYEAGFPVETGEAE